MLTFLENMFNDDLDDAYPSTGSQKIDSGSSHKYSEKGGHRDRNDRNNRDRGERDREGGNVYQASTQIPEPVKNFLLVFQHALQEHNIYQIQNIYETGQQIK